MADGFGSSRSPAKARRSHSHCRSLLSGKWSRHMTKCILVVEDQPDNRQIIRDMLAAAFRFGSGRRLLIRDALSRLGAPRPRGKHEILRPSETPSRGGGTE